MLSMAMTILQVNTDLVADVIEMDAFSWIFMLTSMIAVSSLTFWCFSRILGGKEHFDPDGTGPAHPPVGGSAETPD